MSSFVKNKLPIRFKNFCMYSTNNHTNLSNVPLCLYSNADVQKEKILQENEKKIGIYRWVNIDSGYSYIGSSKNLSIRFRQYFNVKFLERESVRNNSRIYRSLLKNGYSKFKLEILEYCELNVLAEKEQFYMDNFKPEYNILTTVGSFKGFKHSSVTKKTMSMKKLKSVVQEEIKLKIATTQSKGVQIKVYNRETGEISSFVSIRKAAGFIDVHTSYVAKSIKLHDYYSSDKFLIYKSTFFISSMEEFILKTKKRKPITLTNIKTNEKSEFYSVSAAAKHIGVSESKAHRCKSTGKPCNGFTIDKI